jgi:hypothetical protein
MSLNYHSLDIVSPKISHPLFVAAIDLPPVPALGFVINLFYKSEDVSTELRTSIDRM